VPRLPKFLAAHPGLTLDVVLDDRIIDLIEEGVDIALRMGPLADSTSLSARKLASGPHHVLGTPAYFARSGVPATPAELATHAAVIYTQQGAGTWCFRQGATEVSVTVSGPLRVSAAEGVRAAVLADMGLTITSAWMFGPELESGAVQRVLTGWSLPPIDLWAVYPTGRMPSTKARAFAAFVEAELTQASSEPEAVTLTPSEARGL
jgi:DNA-binding transcriptional LysR family regulator